MTVPAATGELLADLLAERAGLVDLLGSLTEEAWGAPSSTGHWSIAEHVGRLAVLDEATALAVTAPERFAATARGRLARRPAPGDLDGPYRSRSGSALLRWLSHAQDKLVRACRSLDGAHRLPWYGTELDIATALSARIADTWAHGRDVAEAVGARWAPTERLRHVAEAGIGALGDSFEVLGRPVPTVPVRVELAAPGGERWVWGPEHARDRVTGEAEELCLVLTGRRAVTEVDLRVSGVVAAEWLRIARPYPGAPEAPGRCAAGAPVW